MRAFTWMWFLCLTGIASADNGKIALAYPVDEIVLDGDFSEWPEYLPWQAVAFNHYGDPFTGPDDFSARFKAAVVWESGEVYVAVEVIDDRVIVDTSAFPRGREGLDGCQVRWAPYAGRKDLCFGITAMEEIPFDPEGHALCAVASFIGDGMRRYEWMLKIDDWELLKDEGKPFSCPFEIEIYDRDTEEDFSAVYWTPTVWKMHGTDIFGDLVVIPPGLGVGRCVGWARSPDTDSGSDGPLLVEFQSINSPRLTSVTRTTGAGRFSVDLPEGHYQARILGSSAPPREVVITVDEDHELSLEPHWETSTRPLVAEARFKISRPVRHGGREFLTTTMGIPDRTVSGLVQDSAGRMWMGTSGGLAWYSGSELQVFSRETNFGNQRVKLLERDPKTGNLWIGCDYGLYHLHENGDVITEHKQFSHARVLALVPAPDKGVFVGTRHGLFHLTDEGVRSFSVEDGLVDDCVFALEYDFEKDYLWIGTEKGMCLLNRQGEVVTLDIPLLNRRRIQAIHKDPDSGVWASSSTKVYRSQDGDSWEEAFASIDGHEHRYCEKIDSRQGEVLFATTEGPALFNTGDGKLTRLNSGLLNVAGSLCIDRDSTAWVGGQHAIMLLKRTWKRLDSGKNLKMECADDGALWYTCQDEDGLWEAKRMRGDERWTFPLAERPVGIIAESSETALIAFEQSVVRIHANGKMERLFQEYLGDQSRIQRMQGAQDGSVWFHLENGLLHIDASTSADWHSVSSGLPAVPRTFDVSSNGALIGGTESGPPFLVSGGEVRILHEKFAKSNGTFLYGLHYDMHDRIWLRLNRGVLRENDHGEFEDLPGGLARIDNTFESISFLGSETWLFSGAGVSRFNGEFYQKLSFEEIPGAEKSTHAVRLGDDIMVASPSGLYAYTPSKDPPSVQIENARTDRDWGRARSIRTTTAQPLTQFDVNGVSLKTTAGDMIYRYRLQGLSDDWQETYETSMTYHDLERGDYVFEVQAIDRDLNASTIAQTEVHVGLPYAQIFTIGALALAGLTILGMAGYLFRRHRAENLMLAARVRERTSDLEALFVEKEAAEQKLVNSEKMEALGTMAAGVAHDFNNTLMAISSQAERALDMARDEPTKDQLRKISETLKSASGITRSLVRFSGQGSSGHCPQNLSDILLGTGELIKSLLSSAIVTSFTVEHPRIMLKCDAGEIQRVLINLAINARDAMPDGGVLEFNLSKVNTRAVLTVSDTGSGISTEALPRVFEPFFTTKERLQGTGLGLSRVHGIITDHKGTVDVASEVGKGTTFTLSLPLLAEVTVKTEKHREHNVSLSGLWILLAEDQESIRTSLDELLTGRGAKVITASNGMEASDQISAVPSELDLVILDVDMPGKSGLQILSEIRRSRKDLPVILITGHLSNEVTSVRDSRLAVLAKPFRMDAFLETIQEVQSNASLESGVV